MLRMIVFGILLGSLIACGVTTSVESPSQEGHSDFRVQAVAARSTSVSRASVASGTLQVKVVATSTGRLYVRYYEQGRMKSQWYTFGGVQIYRFSFPKGASNLYVYAEVYQGSVRLELPASVMVSATAASSSTSALERLLQSKGLTMKGSVTSDQGAWYVDTRKGSISGRAYLDPSKSRIVAYVEDPLLAGFLRDGGVRSFGLLTRDQFTLLPGILSYVTTERGSYLYGHRVAKGWFFDSALASVYFQHVAQLGTPLKVVSGVVLAEKGMVLSGNKQVLSHRVFGLPLGGSPRVSQSYLGLYQWPNRHTGTDYGVPTGTPVYSVANGEVVAVTKDAGSKSWGNVIKIKHFVNAKNGQPLYSQYAHLSTMTVRVGQLVQKGERIGSTGSTGFSTAPHLHFGLFDGRVSGHGAGYLASPNTAGYIDPVAFLRNPSLYIQ